MISGIWANTNLDDDSQTKSKVLTQIEEDFQKALIDIYNGVGVAESDKIDWTDPFFAAMKLPPDEPGIPVPDRTTTKEEKFEIDQR